MKLCAFPRADRGCPGAAAGGKKKVSFLNCVLRVKERPRKFKLETIMCQSKNRFQVIFVVSDATCSPGSLLIDSS